MKGAWRAIGTAAFAALLPAAPAQVARGQVLESFDSVAAFQPLPSDGVSLTLRADSGVAGSAVRYDFDFHGNAGYAVARRSFALAALPPNWAITLRVRGSAPPNTLELKFVDSTGQNVWWMRRLALGVTAAWTTLRFRPSDLSFAWGPLGGGPPRGIAALEISVTAGEGGRGWIAFDQLALTSLPLPVADSVRPRVTASSSETGSSPDLAVLRDFYIAPRVIATTATGSGWHSAGDGAQWLELDFGGVRQLGGLVLDWSTTDWPVDYDVQSSDDGLVWSVQRTVRGAAGDRRFIHLPALETARLRLALHRSSRGAGYGLRVLHLLADSVASTRSAFLERVAQASLPGTWPRPLAAQQSYWTVVGIPRDVRDAPFSEDGNVESRPGSFSVEPFLHDGATLLTWADGTTAQSLDDGALPIPTARRIGADLELATTSFATGTPGHSVVWIRYRVVNRRAGARTVQLFAAIRPVQVNPPWQFLGTPGGAAAVRSLRWDGRAIVVNDTDRVVAVTPPTHVGISAFDAGSVVERMRSGTLPAVGEVADSTGFASGAFSWTLALAPRDSADVWLALPAPGDELAPNTNPLAAARTLWQRELGEVQLSLPADGAALARTARTALGYVLINTRGRAIQPGTRSYRRSWIRDGALTSAALLRLGHASDVGAFLDWYVPYVFADGKVPCCVDARGADPVTENDADGELLFLAAEYWRFTRDSAIIARHWPVLSRVAAHLDSLRGSRRTERYRTPDSLLVFGLLPPSISHEGYSARPAYSYWDDWWGVRGLDDAGTLAAIVGDTGAAARYRAAGIEMRRDLVASIARSMALHRIATLPGAAELGDLDPTSSTIALDPVHALDDLPRDAVLATFDSAWHTLARRIARPASWEIYTPYEWRDVGSFIRLGQPERAQAYASWLMTTRRPVEWNQWSEAIWRDARAPKFIGDMPHGWVMSDFVRSTLTMLAYERERDSVLVVGAGIPLAWARDPAGVSVRRLRTWWGPLDLSMKPVGGTVLVTLDGAHPPGGIELRAPHGRRPRMILVNGVRAAATDGGRAVTVRAPATVEFRY
jgi:hypothetical protein